jgi:hypothetical protein
MKHLVGRQPVQKRDGLLGVDQEVDGGRRRALARVGP